MTQVSITPNGIVASRLTLGLKQILAVAQDLQAEGGNPQEIAYADDILALLTNESQTELIQSLIYVYVSLQYRVLRHYQSIILNATNITELEAALDAASVAIADLSGALSTLSTTVGGHTTTLGTHTTAIGLLDSAMTAAASAISALQTLTSGHTTSISDQGTAIGALQTLTSGHTTSISDQGTAIGALQTLTSGHTTSINTLNGQMATAQGDIVTALGQLAAAIGTTVQAYDADTMKSDTSRLLTAAFYSTPVALSIVTGSVAVDLSTRNVFSLTVNDDFTLAYPASAPAMPGAGMWLIYATQDGTGGHDLTLAAGYRLVAGEWSTSPNQVNMVFIAAQSANPAILDVWIVQRGVA